MPVPDRAFQLEPGEQSASEMKTAQINTIFWITTYMMDIR